jgi:lipopolysaccharide transport system permease protein
MPVEQVAGKSEATAGQRPVAGEQEGSNRQVIRAQSGLAALNWEELWRYRELLYFLTWRDVKIRYKQTVLGAAWAVLQPFITMVIFSIVLGRMANMQQFVPNGVPYPIYVFAALLPWTFFANAITNSSNSLVGSANLITKVYFPRLCIPLAAVAAGVVDFLVSALVLMAMMLFYHVPVTPQIVLAPVLLAGCALVATGVGTLLSALTVEFRDFRYVVPFLVQVWMYASPVIYPAQIVHGALRPFYFLNPMAGLIEGFRGAFLGTPLDLSSVSLALALSVACFVGGAAYFRAVERRFADII